jgi:hypothetical protein
MKVFLVYSPASVSETHHKTLKVTLPKKWTKQPPGSNLMDLFVENYNSSKPTAMSLTLEASDLVLTTAGGKKVYCSAGPSAVAVEDCMEDKAEVFVTPLSDVPIADRENFVPSLKKQASGVGLPEAPAKTGAAAHPPGFVRCVHLGCQKYFDPKTEPVCVHHKSPPVFHETAKWWSCCPHKKAYDWEGFQTIPGCETGVCSNVKDEGAASTSAFMGGCELRGDDKDGEGLMDINAFNSKEGAKKKLDGIGAAFTESWCDLDKASWEQMIAGMEKEIEETGGPKGVTLEEAVLQKVGASIKKSMKAVIVEQMRIK